MGDMNPRWYEPRYNNKLRLHLAAMENMQTELKTCIRPVFRSCSHSGAQQAAAAVVEVKTCVVFIFYLFIYLHAGLLLWEGEGGGGSGQDGSHSSPAFN